MGTLLMMFLLRMIQEEKRHLLPRVGLMKRLCKEIPVLEAMEIINNQANLNKKN